MLPKGYKHSKEARRRISEAKRKHWKDPDYRAKMSASLKGKTGHKNRGKKRPKKFCEHLSEVRKKQWADPEYRTKMLKSQVNGMRGKHHTEEARRKISEATSGENNPYHKKWLRGEAMAGVSHPFYGKSRSASVKEKIRESLSGRIRPDLAGPNNGMWGKPPQHSKTCKTLKGHPVRSTWERVVCDWLHTHGIEYDYEPDTFEFDDITYTPDIYISQWNCYWEVKGWWDSRSVEQVSRFIDEKLGVLMIIDKENIGLFQEGDL